MQRSVPIVIILAFFIFFSCKKEHAPAVSKISVNTKKYSKVNFNIGGFSQAILNSLSGKKTYDLDPSDTSSTDTLSLLYYTLYDASGDTVETHKYNSTTGTFSNISDSLKIGNYTAVFVAGKQGLNYIHTNKYSSFLGGDYFAYITQGEVYPWHDVFFKRIALSITGNDTSLNINMKRLVGQLQINIQDKIPANTNNIRLTITNYISYFYAAPSTRTPGAMLYGIQSGISSINAVPQSAIGTTGFNVYNLMGADPSLSMTVEISAYDNSNNLTGDAVVKNVTLLPNQKTILSGNLFGGSQGNSIPITINSNWQVTPFQTIGF